MAQSVHLLRYAVMKDAPTKPSRKEFVEDMGQEQGNANMKDVPTKQRKEVCA